MATKGIKLRDKDNNVILPVTSSDLVEVKYGNSSKILTNLLEENEQVTAEALSDLNDRLLQIPDSVSISGTTGEISDGTVFIPFAGVSYNSNYIKNAGAVLGAIQDNYNRGSANVTAVPVSGNYGADGIGSNKAVSLRYETPKLNFLQGLNGASTFPTGTVPSSSVNKNYYDTVKNTKYKTNIYSTAAGSVSYAPLIDGNNYCCNNGTTYEMYFFNTDRMMNYLTAYARWDLGQPLVKEITANNIWQWGSMSGNDDLLSTLCLTKSAISFRKEYSGTAPTGSCSVIDPTHVISGTIIAGRMDRNNPATSQRTEITNDSIKIYASSEATTADIRATVAYFIGQDGNYRVYANKFYEVSDKNVKNNITPITYNPNDIDIYSFVINGANSYSYGFIAQDVAETHPELVSYTNNSYLSVDYNSTLSLLLAKAINRIDELENRVKELEKKIK